LAFVSRSESTGAPRTQLGLWSATALVVGHTIAIGVFLTPAELIGAVGWPLLTLALWVACGALILAGAFTFGELAARYPVAGGPYVYLRQGWGERIAFLYGWQSLLVMDPGVTAALAIGASEYIVLLWPAAGGGERWLAIGVVWTLVIVSIGGLRLSARVLGIITGFKLLALVAVVIVAFAAGTGSWSHFQPVLGRQASTVPLGEAMALGLVSVFFSFGGFWEASRMAGEVRNVTRTLPLALAVGVTCVTVVYVATTMAFVYIVPPQQVTSASEFARQAGDAMLGPAGPSILASIVVLSVVASILALLIMAPRLYVAMSRDGLFPAALASVNPVTQSPARATTLLGVLASLFVSVGTFQQIIAFFMCTSLGFITLAAAALVVIRRRARGGTSFRAPGYPVTTALFVLLLFSVVTFVGINQPLQAITGFMIVLLGLPAHHFFARHKTER
jgi:APA family basic amino acid/polyamine antiporter